MDDRTGVAGQGDAGGRSMTKNSVATPLAHRWEPPDWSARCTPSR